MSPLRVVWVKAPKSKVRHMVALPSKNPIGATSDNRQLFGGKTSEFRDVPREHASDTLYCAHVDLAAAAGTGQGETVHGIVRWQGYDDAWRETAMPYRPLQVARQHGPADLPTDDAPTSNVRLTILLRNTRGVDLAGVPFRLQSKLTAQQPLALGRGPTSGNHVTVSGATFYHQAGSWRLVAEDAEIAALVDPCDFELPDSGDVVVPLRLKKDIGAVIFRGADRRVPPTSMRLSVWRDSRKLFNVSVNGAMTASRWLPVGDYRVSYVIQGVSPVQWKSFSITSLVDELTVDLDQS
jgi:hypothetical protein